MTTINPFRGLRFNQEKNENLADLISPPYDKISPEDRKELWNRHENNVVRLILPPPSDKDIDVMTQSMDSESADWYAKSAERLHQWIQEGVIKQDPRMLYIYKQSFSYQGIRYTREGLFVALLLEDNQGPHAHEFTFEGPKADRLRLLQATETNLSPIFLLSDGTYDEWNQLFAQNQTELLHFVDHEGQEHILYGVVEGSECQALQKYVQARTLVIADGHHRYETAVNYRRMMKEKTGKDPINEAWGYVYALIVPISTPGLLVLPTHRVVKNLPPNWVNTLKERTASYFDCIPVPNPNENTLSQLFNDPGNGNGIVVHSSQESFFLKRKSASAIPEISAIPEAIRELNVSLLHYYIFSVCLALTKEDLQGITRYVRGEDEALDMVNSGQFEAAFLLKGIPPSQVFEVSLTGERMPQKSTDFYPKIPTGLIMRTAKGSI